MKTTRKVTAILIALMLLSGVFTGCSADNGGKDTAEKTTVATDNAGEDTAANTTAVTEQPTTSFSSAKAGDILEFGNYEQDNDLTNGKEPIAWRVLAVENGKAFLLAEKILDVKPYNVEEEEVTWETCTLRAWLNNEFLNDAFNAGEKAKIHTTRVVNEDNLEYGTDGGNDTDDKVFLLSYSEGMNPAYGFSSSHSDLDTARQAQGTDFSKSNGLWVNEDSSYLGNSFWWLRTPGHNQDYARYVYIDGNVYYYSTYVSYTRIGVRPALWINL